MFDLNVALNDPVSHGVQGRIDNWHKVGGGGERMVGTIKGSISLRFCQIFQQIIVNWEKFVGKGKKPLMTIYFWTWFYSNQI